MEGILKTIKEYWVLLVIGAAIIVLVWVYFKGKGDAETKEIVLELSDGTKYNPTDLAKRLGKTLKDWCFWCGDRCAALAEALKLSDEKLRALAKAYKELHGTDIKTDLEGIKQDCGGYGRRLLQTLD